MFVFPIFTLVQYTTGAGTGPEATRVESDIFQINSCTRKLDWSPG